MQSIRLLKGVIVPLVTPMQKNGDVDFEGLARVIDHVVEGGAQGLLVLGSCGEFASLSTQQRLEVVQAAVKANAGRAVVTVGTADSSLRQVVEFTEKVGDLGADAAVVTTPFYFHLNEAETIDFYKTLDRECSVPIIAYNIPRFTGNPVTPKVVDAISGCRRIIGIKDTGMDFASFFTILSARKSPDFRVYMGDESHIVPSLLLGADGFVPSIGNLAPTLCVQLYEAAISGEGNWKELWTQFNLLRQVYGTNMWIKGLKAALKVMGLCEPYMVPPFAPASDEQLRQVEGILKRAGLID